MTEMSLTEQLCTLLHRPVTAEDRSRAAFHVLDWLGCAFIGSTTPAGRVMLEYGLSAPRGPCATIGVGEVLPEMAAFVNGAFGNVLEMDDIHRTSVLHPGPIVIPAALAAAQSAGVDGYTFLDSIVAGYEIMIRIGDSVGPGHYRYFHNTATCGPFGAAAATGVANGLSDEKLVWALGNAGSLTGGFWQMRNVNVMTKQLHNAHAARSGLVAALLARGGMTAAVCPDADQERVMRESGDKWKIFDTSFKPWPACRHAHPVIDAALKLREQLAAEDIKSVKVFTYDDAIEFCDRETPETVNQAKFSIQHVFAIVMLDGKPAMNSFEPDAFRRDDVVALRSKVMVHMSEKFCNAYPQHYGAAIEATILDGRCVRSEVSDALGDPGNPVNNDEVIAKATELMLEAGIDSRTVFSIIENTLSLASGGSLKELGSLLIEVNGED